MSKEYTCLGMMSGTSGDGVDASIIQSDGLDKFTVLREKYYEYDESLFRDYQDLKKKINSSNDLKKILLIKNLKTLLRFFMQKLLKILQRI